MDYGLGSTLAFKCIFCYDFISIFYIGSQYMILDGKKNMNWKILQQKLLQTNNYGLLNDPIWTLFF
jgi:hypothetical protein